jgi:hypothetical protein
LYKFFCLPISTFDYLTFILSHVCSRFDRCRYINSNNQFNVPRAQSYVPSSVVFTLTHIPYQNTLFYCSYLLPPMPFLQYMFLFLISAS